MIMKTATLKRYAAGKDKEGNTKKSSYTISIAPAVIEALGWSENDNIMLVVQPDHSLKITNCASIINTI